VGWVGVGWSFGRFGMMVCVMRTTWRSETELQSAFTPLVKTDDGRRWLKSLGGSSGFAFELKLVCMASQDRAGRFRWSQLSGGQVEALNDAAGAKGLIYKISDSSLGWIPFDCLVLLNSFSSIIIGFQGKGVLSVEISKIILEVEKKKDLGLKKFSWSFEELKLLGSVVWEK